MDTVGEIQKAMDEVAAYQRELAEALAQRDLERVTRLMGQLAVAERRRNRLLQAEATTTGGADPTPPIREQVIAALGLLGHPSAVSLVKEVSAARFGEVIQSNRLASLRRDEQRSWSATRRGTARSQARPTYITPALTYDRFAPMRGLLALSSWSLESRLVGPTSPRVDLLRIIIRLTTELDRGPDTPWAPDLRRLIWRFGRTVASSMPHSPDVSYIHVREAAQRELDQIVDVDTAERAEAADRARKLLDPEDQLFGTTMHITSAEAAG
ncbi:hypothetical protein [Actinoplanes philippinensis]|uniref:hypothetical protein n=1 Tax=Actinoplanes philippinensis TaxID=35752 RepID=UPI0033CBE243